MIVEEDTIDEDPVDSCPYCGEQLDTDELTIVGYDVAEATQTCPDCPFEAVEHWSHDRTAEVKEGEEQ